MTITDRLRLELWLRENIHKYGDDFYAELARILEKINDEQVDPDTRGRPNLVSLRGRG
jgi:hypothetical protein